CRDGFADGVGTVQWFSAGLSNGTTSGLFKDGRLMGKGSVTLPHAVYMHMLVSGRGASVRRAWPTGSRLDGEFFENQLVGDGIITTPGGGRALVNEVDGKLIRKGPLAPKRVPAASR